MTQSVVAVIGATGHTGRFVVAEILRRGWTPIAVARSAESLAAAGFPDEVVTRQATIHNGPSLDASVRGAQVVVNCAGPFADTAFAVAGAAVRAGIHYLDIAAEQSPVQQIFDALDTPARRAGVTLVPAMALYGGLSDLLATAALGDWDRADSVTVLTGLSSWHPTRGSRKTIDRNETGTLVVADGALVSTAGGGRISRSFPAPLGDHQLVEVPLSEIILIAQHVPAGEVRSYISEIAIGELLDPDTTPPVAVDDSGRSDQRFVMEVVVTRAGRQRRARVQGRDGYAVSAPIICEAIDRLVQQSSTATGARAPGEIFDAAEFLTALDLGYALAED